MIPAFLRPFRFIVIVVVLTSCSIAVAGESHKAVKGNHISTVKKLIKGNPDLVASKDEDGFTPLHLAAAYPLLRFCPC